MRGVDGVMSDAGSGHDEGDVPVGCSVATVFGDLLDHAGVHDSGWAIPTRSGPCESPFLAWKRVLAAAPV